MGELDNLLLANLISAPLLPLRLGPLYTEKEGILEVTKEVAEVEEGGGRGYKIATS